MNAKNKSTATHKEAKADVAPGYIVHQLGDDVRNSVLVVSLLINVFMLIGWLVIQVTTRYDTALVNYLQNR